MLMFVITQAASQTKRCMFLVCSLYNVNRLLIHAVPSLFFSSLPVKCAIFFSLSVPLLCYAGLSTVGARAGTSRREREKKPSGAQ